MRSFNKLFVLLLILNCYGCATVITQYEMRDGQHAKAPFDTGEQRSIKSKIYSGTVFAAKAQVAPAGSGGNIGGLIFLIDLPLSIVADTLILPYTGYYEFSKTEPEKYNKSFQQDK